MVYESGGGRPKWVSCRSGWLSRWTYVVCLYRPLTLVGDGVAATEEGSERVRSVVSCDCRCFGDESETFRGPPGVRAWISRLVHRGSQSETMCRKDREARSADLGHKGKVRGRLPQGRRTGRV